jgi:hypothetical protein
MCGERISCGSGVWRRVGMRSCRIRRAGRLSVPLYGAVDAQLQFYVLFPSFIFRSSGCECCPPDGGVFSVGKELLNHTSGDVPSSVLTVARHLVIAGCLRTTREVLKNGCVAIAPRLSKVQGAMRTKPVDSDISREDKEFPFDTLEIDTRC